MLLLPAQDSSDGDNALVAINLKASNAFCQLRFWYWISDSVAGTINVYSRVAVGANMNLLQTIKYDSSNTWVRASIPISQILQPSQVNECFFDHKQKS